MKKNLSTHPLLIKQWQYDYDDDDDDNDYNDDNDNDDYDDIDDDNDDMIIKYWYDGYKK